MSTNKQHTLSLLNIPIDLPEDIKEERRGTSWARATRELRRLRHMIEAVGGSKDQWEAGVWHMDKECESQSAGGGFIKHKYMEVSANNTLSKLPYQSQED